MAKNFGKAGSMKQINAVAKASGEKANIVQVKLIADENLFDFEKNGEDITHTEDLELSMQENGFTDPIEVTDFGMESGKYTIVSGHRRRMAGRKVGIETFPCIVRKFNSEVDLHNAVLLANSQRDSSKDPLLFCNRYKMHEEYLREKGFKGSIREEVAKRLGISVQQADRYNMMNKIIREVWDMVRAEQVGMSSVQPMASHPVEEQKEIYKIMQEALKANVDLTRATVKEIVDGYRTGKKTWAEIKDLPRDSGLPLNSSFSTEPSETKPQEEKNRNDEMRRDFDPISAEADKIDEQEKEWRENQEENTRSEDENVEEVSEDEEKEAEMPVPKEKKQSKKTDEIILLLEKLEMNLNDIYEPEDEKEAVNMLRYYRDMCQILIGEVTSIGKRYKLDERMTEVIEEIKETIEEAVE